MIYILLNENKQGIWQESYENLYMDAFDILGFPLIKITLDKVNKLNSDDYLWVMHYEDLNKVYSLGTKAKVISQVNGTSKNPYTVNFPVKISPAVEKWQYDNVVDTMLLQHEKMLPAFSEFKTNKCVSGFPVSVPDRYKSAKKVKNTIVVGTKLSPEKNPYFLMWLCKPLAVLGYKVTFCIPKNNKQKKWFNWFGLSAFFEHFEFKFLDRDEYLRELSISDYFLIASLGDVFPVSLLEADACGCYCIVPHITDPLPAYDALISKKYTFGNQNEMIHLVNTRPEYNFDSSYYNPVVCASKILSYTLNTK